MRKIIKLTSYFLCKENNAVTVKIITPARLLINLALMEAEMSICSTIIDFNIISNIDKRNHVRHNILYMNEMFSRRLFKMVESKKSKPKEKLLSEKGCLNKKPEIIKDEMFLKYDFFDSKDLIQVKYEMVRRVKKDGWTISKASEIFGLSRPSFYEAKKVLDKEGLPGLIPQQRGPKSAHKLSDEIMDYIEETIKKDKALRPPDLIKIIEKRFGFKVHRRSIERALTRRKKK